MTVNKVILLGRLGGNPEEIKTKSGVGCCTFTVATNEKTKEGQEKTEWHNIKMFGQQANNAVKYLKKGSQVYIEGKLHTETYEKNNEKRYFTNILVTTINFIDRKEKVSDDDVNKKETPSTDDVPF